MPSVAVAMDSDAGRMPRKKQKNAFQNVEFLGPYARTHFDEKF